MRRRHIFHKIREQQIGRPSPAKLVSHRFCNITESIIRWGTAAAEANERLLVLPLRRRFYPSIQQQSEHCPTIVPFLAAIDTSSKFLSLGVVAGGIAHCARRSSVAYACAAPSAPPLRYHFSSPDRGAAGTAVDVLYAAFVCMWCVFIF